MVRELRDRNAASPTRDARTALLNRIAQQRARQSAAVAPNAIARSSGDAIESAHSAPLPDSDDDISGSEPEKNFTPEEKEPTFRAQALDGSHAEGISSVLEGLQDLSLGRSRTKLDRNGGSSSSSSNSSLISKKNEGPTSHPPSESQSDNFVKLKKSQGRTFTAPVELSSDDDDFEPRHRAKAPVVPLRRSPRGHQKKAESKGVNTSDEATRRVEAGGGNSDESSESVHLGNDLVLGEGRRKYTLSGSIAVKLYDHQRSGINWLWGLHQKEMGGILGDDMGLGKTMQQVVWILLQRADCSILRWLVPVQAHQKGYCCCSKTLLAHWTKELTAVGLGRRTHSFVDASVRSRELSLLKVLQMGGVLLTTYDMVRCNWKCLRGDVHGRDGFGDTSDVITTWDYLVLDEGHLIKNPSTERAKSLRELPSTHRVIISGTPIQNNLKEMWALMDFCCPGLLGEKKEFKEKYENQIVAGNDKRASDRTQRLGSAVAQELRDKMAPFFLRRMKSEVFPEEKEKAEAPTLSRKNDLIIWLQLTPRQAHLYRAFLESAAVENALTTRNPLTALSVLKKICDHPSLLTKRAAEDIADGMEGILDGSDSIDAEVLTASLKSLARTESDLDRADNQAASCKLSFLFTLLDKLLDEGHRTLIFSQTRKMLNIIQEELEARRWDYRRIDGTFKSTERAVAVDDFQSDPDIPFFLLTSQVGGLGLTLTAANRVVIIDPAWNPSVDNQSVDRAYRIGQEKDVVVYRLMTCGTIEEKIYRKQVFKGGLFKVATETKNQIKYFSQEELKDLFRVPPTGFLISVTQKQLAEEHFGEHRTSRDLEEHISYIESLSMIAGVSHHDVLYSKAAPALPPAEEGQDDTNASWEPRNPAYRGSSRPSSEESYTWQESDAARPRLPAYDDGLEASKHAWLRVSFLKDKIQRLAAMLEDEDTLTKLPDGGSKIIQKIKEYTGSMEDLKPKAAAYVATLKKNSKPGSERGRGTEDSLNSNETVPETSGESSVESIRGSIGDDTSTTASVERGSSKVPAKQGKDGRSDGRVKSRLDKLMGALNM